jgi:ORF 12 gene product N-terminal
MKVRTVGSLLVVVVGATLLLWTGPANAVRAPQTAAGRQLEWLLTTLNGSAVPSRAELERHFSPTFLNAVPTEQLLEALAPVWSGRPLRLSAVLARDGQFAVSVRVTARTGASFRLDLRVSSASSHRIEGLLIQPLAPSGVHGLRQVDAALRKGGSEPGVLSLTWYLQRRDGHSFVLSIVINDSRRDIDTLVAVGAAQSAV